MKRIELRTNFVRWHYRIAKHAQRQINDMLSSRNPDGEKIVGLKKTVEHAQEEMRRYSLAAKVCGNEVLTVR